MEALKLGDRVIVRPDAPTRLFGQEVIVDEIVIGTVDGTTLLGVTGTLDGKAFRDHLRLAWVYNSDSEDMHDKCYACNARVSGESADFWKHPTNAKALLNDILHHIRYGKPAFAVGDEQLLRLATEMYAKTKCGTE